MARKPDGRRQRSYTIAQPPNRGCAIVAVDQHTATIRTADPLTADDIDFLADVLTEVHKARRISLDPEPAALGVPAGPDVVHWADDEGIRFCGASTGLKTVFHAVGPWTCPACVATIDP